MTAYAPTTKLMLLPTGRTSKRGGLEHLLRHALGERRLVPAANEEDRQEQDRERVEAKTQGVVRVERSGIRLHLMNRPPPTDGHVHDRVVDRAEDPRHGTPEGTPLRFVDE